MDHIDESADFSELESDDDGELLIIMTDPTQIGTIRIFVDINHTGTVADLSELFCSVEEPKLELSKITTQSGEVLEVAAIVVKDSNEVCDAGVLSSFLNDLKGLRIPAIVKITTTYDDAQTDDGVQLLLNVDRAFGDAKFAFIVVNETVSAEDLDSYKRMLNHYEGSLGDVLEVLLAAHQEQEQPI